MYDLDEISNLAVLLSFTFQTRVTDFLLWSANAILKNISVVLPMQWMQSNKKNKTLKVVWNGSLIPLWSHKYWIFAIKQAPRNHPENLSYNIAMCYEPLSTTGNLTKH